MGSLALRQQLQLLNFVGGKVSSSRNSRASKIRQVLRHSVVQIVTAALATLLGILGIVVGSLTVGPDQQIRIDESYRRQLEELDVIQQNIGKFSSFVETQKRELEVRQEAVVSLQSEQEKLKRLVGQDRKVVEAIFEEQERRARNNVWGDRLIGIIVGVLGSLVANLIWAMFSDRPVTANRLAQTKLDE